MKKLCVWAVAALLMAACTPKAEKATDSGLLQSKFQTEVDGKKTDLFTLRNKNNMEVCITNFGGRIVSVMVPDKDGQMRDVVLGFDANRINQGQFTLDGVEYQLPRNNYGHCLHGGPQGFQYRVFDAELLNPQELQLTYRAEDGEEGFPGNITCKVVMKLTDDNAIDIQYEAETDKPTIVNMTNHSYFNLEGDAGNNSGHLLMVDADYYTPVDSTFMTTGEIVPVEGTPMDFRTPHTVGERINDKFQQLIYGAGYAHCYVLNKAETGSLDLAATCKEPNSGRIMEVYTTEAGVQLYTGNWLGGFEGTNGATFPARSAICFEAQCFPDTPNKAHFPSATLLPGDEYQQVTIYKFGVEK